MAILIINRSGREPVQTGSSDINWTDIVVVEVLDWRSKSHGLNSHPHALSSITRMSLCHNTLVLAERSPCAADGNVTVSLVSHDSVTITTESSTDGATTLSRMNLSATRRTCDYI